MERVAQSSSPPAMPRDAVRSWSGGFGQAVLCLLGLLVALVPFLRMWAPANIELLHWNMYFDLGLGLLSAVATVALLVVAIGRGSSIASRCLLAAPISLLVFSPSQLNDYDFGISADLNVLPHVALAVSIFAAVCVRRAWLSLVLACVSIIFAAWCGTPGLSATPAAWVAFHLVDRLRRMPAIALGLATGIALAPYVIWGLLYPTWTAQNTRLQFPRLDGHSRTRGRAARSGLLP